MSGIVITMEGSKELRQALTMLQANGPSVVARGMNEGSRGMKTDLVRTLAKKLTLKQKDIRPQIYAMKASRGDLRCGVGANAKRAVPLIKFSTWPAGLVKRKPKEGVSAQILRDGSRKVIPGSFVARMRSGHIGVFERRSKDTKRLPVNELWGVGIFPYMVKGQLHDEFKIRSRERVRRGVIRALRFEQAKLFRKTNKLRGKG